MRTELSAAYLVAALMGATAAHAQSQPSAVEIFKLRDMCQANANALFAKLKVSNPIAYNRVLVDPRDSIEITSNLSPKTAHCYVCLLYTSPSPRDRQKSRMPSSA